MSKVYELITNQVIEELEKGQIIWQKPFKTAGFFPSNLISKAEYSGCNVLLTSYSSYKNGFSSPFWLTFKQAKQIGADVKKGSKSTKVIFYAPIEKEDQQTKEKETYSVLRYYNVFNADQVDNIPAKFMPAPEKVIDFEPIEQAEKIIQEFKNKPEIKTGFSHAGYLPLADRIEMPEKDNFISPADYYSTIYHELAHSTGHANRLNRPGITEKSPFGSKLYSREELIAELTAIFLCNRVDIQQTFKNSVGYIQSWIKALKNDSKLLFHASAQAQKASNYILNIQ